MKTTPNAKYCRTLSKQYCSLSLWIFCFSLFLHTVAANSFAQDSLNKADYYQPTILKVWEKTIATNRGVHAWNSDNDGLLVFQEWIASMILARHSSEVAQIKLGRKLENYVVGGNIKPLGYVGTTLPVPGFGEGDFDMTLLSCMTLLGTFERDTLMLTHKTYVHLLRQVICLWGQTPKENFDIFFLSFPETENHLFMSESIRYLTNQILYENPRHLIAIKHLRDSLTHAGIELNNNNGVVRRLLLKNMQLVLSRGLFEFNAKVYQRFTLHALDNLYSFASDSTLVAASQSVLHYLATKFAFQSFNGIRFGPYRRNSEKFADSSLIDSDAACSFFAIQSGKFNWDNNYWFAHRSHAAMALYSTVLKYRVPDILLDFMQNRENPYWALFSNGINVEANGGQALESYYGAPHFLMSAGGQYTAYAGRNFPTQGFWLKKAPWVYDVVSRSSSVILDPAIKQPYALTDILHFKGAQWKANNLALHQNFLYGYAEASHRKDWPQAIPSDWQQDGEIMDGGGFEFRFYDQSRQGVFIVLTRLKNLPSWRFWERTSTVRGTIEVVDTAEAHSLVLFKAKMRQQNMQTLGNLFTAKRLYTTYKGVKLTLNPSYDNTHTGIVKIQSPQDKAIWKQGLSPVFKKSNSLLQVNWIQADGLLGQEIASGDGQGNLQVINPHLQQELNICFKEWWNPWIVMQAWPVLENNINNVK